MHQALETAGICKRSPYLRDLDDCASENDAEAKPFRQGELEARSIQDVEVVYESCVALLMTIQKSRTDRRAKMNGVSGTNDDDDGEEMETGQTRTSPMSATAGSLRNHGM